MLCTIVSAPFRPPTIEHDYQDGCTALHHAAENGHALVVYLLLSTPGIDVNAKEYKVRG